MAPGPIFDYELIWSVWKSWTSTLATWRRTKVYLLNINQNWFRKVWICLWASASAQCTLGTVATYPKRHLNLIWSPLGHISRVSLIKKRHLIKISDIVLIFARWETVESADGENSRWEMIIVAYYTSCVTLIFLYAYAAKFLFQKYKLYKKVGKWLWSIRYRDYCIIKHFACERFFPT